MTAPMQRQSTRCCSVMRRMYLARTRSTKRLMRICRIKPII